jgi:regulator of protease activity HflC (stomatin/prohibitin superfamily)
MDNDTKTGLQVFGTIVVILLILVTLIGGIVTTPAGYINIVLQGGKAVGVRDPGYSVKMPLIEGLQTMSTQTLLYEDNNSSAGTKDLQEVTTNLAVNYHLDKAYATDVYNNLGVNYMDKVGHNTIQEALKEITARYPAEDMIIKRAQVKDDIAKAITERLAYRHIVVESVSILNFAFSKEFSAAIESKVAAAQAVKQAENKLEQIKVEAEQAVAQAKGQADAIAVLNSTLTPAYLQYMYINKLAPDVKIIVVPQGMPIVIPQQ